MTINLSLDFNECGARRLRLIRFMSHQSLTLGLSVCPTCGMFQTFQMLNVVITYESVQHPTSSSSNLVTFGGMVTAS